MKKQYWLGKEHNFKRRVILFDDGKPIIYFAGFESEVEEFLEQAESEGYIKGYLTEEVIEAHRQYSKIKENTLHIGYSEIWDIEEKMKNEKI